MSADLKITFADEAWEFMYDILDRMVEKGYSVSLNGQDVELVGYNDKGDKSLYRNDWAIIAKPWHEESQEFGPETIEIPLFDATGVVAITSVHVF